MKTTDQATVIVLNHGSDFPNHLDAVRAFKHEKPGGCELIQGLFNKWRSLFPDPRFWISSSIWEGGPVSEDGGATTENVFILGIRCTERSKSSMRAASISEQSMREPANG